eukprot:jgi/Galph1/2516/GphlegSOOS_G1156.1
MTRIFLASKSNYCAHGIRNLFVSSLIRERVTSIVPAELENVCYMKSIHHSEALSLSNRTHTVFENDEWKKIILETPEHENSILQQIQLDSVDLASSLVVGIVCKGCWKSEGLNWSDIIVLSESLKTCHCMLNIAGTKLSSTVATKLNNESRCYSSGSLIGDTFKISTNCELVILSQNDLEIYWERNIEWTWKSICQDSKTYLGPYWNRFMQQVCTWLMFKVSLLWLPYFY